MAKWKRKYSLSRRWQKNQLVNKYGAICYLCKKPFKNIKQITIDHWIPLALGGTDTLENYRLAHYDCNQLKGMLSPEGFKRFQDGRAGSNDD